MTDVISARAGVTLVMVCAPRRWNPEAMRIAATAGISSCATCPLGRASGVGRGGACPFHERTFPSGAIVHGEGRRAEALTFVKRGVVLLVRATPHGHELVRAFRRAGEILGAEALVGGLHTDTARALGPVTVCRASWTTLDGWLGLFGTARVLLDLLVRTDIAEPPRGATPDGNAMQRAARWIADHEDDRLAVGIPRHALAGLLGMTPETLSRALASLRRRGAIEVGRTSMRVVDRALLASLAAT